MQTRGVILQAGYRIFSGTPVVHLYGRMQDGATFLIREHRQRPHFYVRNSDAALAAELTDRPVLETGLRNFAGEPVSRVEVRVPADAPAIRDRLHDQGAATFEADVRFAVRYLIDRNIRGACLIEGEAQPGQGTTWVFDDPQISPTTLDIEPRILSFDIETDAAAKQLLAISLYGCGADEVLICDPRNRDMPEQAIGCPDEWRTLQAFCERVAELDPDVLTGWNVIDFDLTVLARVAARVGHPFELGRGKGELRLRPAQGYFGSGSANVPGRVVLDGIDLLRGAFVRMDDYSLDAVGRQVLGEGKALEGDVNDRAGEIMHRYQHDLEGFARYARTDARLVREIVDKLNLIRLAFARSALTGMTPDRVAASIASFDFLYLAALGPKGYVAPTVRSNDSRVFEAQSGGHVFEPVTGIHENVWVFDFKSLYPSIIRTFNIDPLGYLSDSPESVESPETEEYIELPGASFRREPGILPAMLEALFPQREAAKRSGDDVASQAIKILMNSFYGVLGTPACRFHNPDIANAITGQGRFLLQWSKDWFERCGYEVLYGDTDSVFVASGLGEASAAGPLGAELAQRCTRELAELVGQRWRVESRLELEFEKLYTKLFLPSVRHGAGGARKRYAGLVQGQDPDAVEFVGMEVVRRDWTQLAKQVQRELYYRLFDDQDVTDYLSDVVQQVREGALDDLLVYRKGLRKPPAEYTATSPPHVVAARKSADVGRIVSYLITLAGPEPMDNLQHEPDREHYVQKQILPVAEPVLGTLGLDFAQVVGDDRQLGLF
jgi:DNA polymerase-2